MTKISNSFGILHSICPECSDHVCNCDDTLVISDVFDRETIHDNLQFFKSDYLNQTLPAKEELITLSRPQIRRMSTGNSCDSNTLYASVQNICKGPVKLYDKLSIGSLNTCGLKRKTEYPEFQSLIKQYDIRGLSKEFVDCF